jgi:hypothetical protein
MKRDQPKDRPLSLVRSEQEQPPTIAVFLTTREATALAAAISHYRTYATRNPELELDRGAVLLEQVGRMLIMEARKPTIPAIDIQAVMKLSQINQAREVIRYAGLGSEARKEAEAAFIELRRWLVQEHAILIHYSLLDEAWHFGWEDAPSSLYTINATPEE